ncbi:MAG TPA: AMP-binding protein, partial [Rudaea sp.]|nr:AMP-binding protein [Rudaea sp.]
LRSSGSSAARLPEASVRAEHADEPAPWPNDAATLVDVLDWHARRHPDQVHIIYSADAGEEPISYGLLWQRAQAFAGALRSRGLEPRQTVAIMLPTCPEYFYTFFGVLCAGGIPVPIYPPARPSQIEEHVRRHSGILSNAATSLLVTVAEARPLARLLKARVPELREIVTAADLASGPAQPIHPEVRGDDIALLQYTSGSTGNPKGVILTHANLLANIRAIGELVRLGPSDVIVSWLPLYHDMGLISTWLASLYFGRPIVIMSPLSFLARPARWLWAIHKHRGTLSAAPNFAYELCIKRIGEEDLQGLDLSSWRLAANGAEQVNPDTIERFQSRFGKYGFRAESMMPVYGLAEATVGLLAPPTGRMPIVDRVQRAAFIQEGRAEPAAPDDARALRFLACGTPLSGHEVRIVDDLGRERGERMEGRLEFKGPSATQGYYRNPEQTRRLFDGDWLDSGDRGYFAGNDFYITGRVKDIIIRGGHHIYPDELEQAVGLLPGIRKGCVAAFGVADSQTGTERLVVLAETRVTDAAQQAALRQAVTRATVELLGEPPDEVVLAPPQTVMKTSSGKIRRSATRDLYQAGQVGARLRSTRWQVARLLASSALPQARRVLRRTGELAYASYAWVLFVLMAVPTYIATVAATGARLAWAINRKAARAFLKAAAIRLSVTGLENLPVGRTFVLVANHASYLDGLALIAALPVPCAFVAKRE